MPMRMSWVEGDLDRNDEDMKDVASEIAAVKGMLSKIFLAIIGLIGSFLMSVVLFLIDLMVRR